MHQLSRKLLGLAAVIGIMSLAGWVKPQKESIAQRWERLQQMTPDQKLRIKQNFQKFQSLTTEDLSRYRTLHETLVNEPSGQGTLRDVMERYLTWLKTLDHDQREALRNETDPQRKHELVTSYKESQITNQVAQQAAARHKFTPREDLRWLEEDDLAAVMSLLEHKLRNANLITAETSAKINESSGLVRYLEILKIAFAREERDRTPKNLTPQLIEELIAKVNDPKLKARFGTLEGAKRGEQLIKSLFTGLHRQLGEELWKANTEEKLEGFLAGLNEDAAKEVRAAKPKHLKYLKTREFYLKEIARIIGLDPTQRFHRRQGPRGLDAL